ncbi:MAG: HD domain-containing protein [Thermovirgaceae bacterium]|nr:HD domain-containing protein [Thermovirgaceae bacterium]
MIKDKIVEMAKNAEDLLAPFCTCRGLGLHGISHLRRVAILSGRLAGAVGEDVESAVVMGFLHDCARRNDGTDLEHPHDSAVLARGLIERFFPHLDVDRICDAIEGHADGEVTTDPLTACLWDADRLELKRIGRTIDLDLLSTKVAKRLARRRMSSLRTVRNVTEFVVPRSH